MHRTVRIADHTADLIFSVDRSGGVTLLHGIVGLRETDHAANFRISGNGTGNATVLHCAVVHTARYTANIVVFVGNWTGNCTGNATVLHCAAAHTARYTANIFIAGDIDIR